MSEFTEAMKVATKSTIRKGEAMKQERPPEPINTPFRIALKNVRAKSKGQRSPRTSVVVRKYVSK